MHWLSLTVKSFIEIHKKDFKSSLRSWKKYNQVFTWIFQQNLFLRVMQKSFAGTSNLKRHQRTVHENEKPCKCVHQRNVHENEKPLNKNEEPFKCWICQPSFSGKSCNWTEMWNLKRH